MRDYQSVINKEVLLPLTDRRIPVIADSYVNMEFGTGCLKVTPAHDMNDFEIGRRHNLPFLQVIDGQGIMTAEVGPMKAILVLPIFFIKLAPACGHIS